jgi:hypothetical protein
MFLNIQVVLVLLGKHRMGRRIKIGMMVCTLAHLQELIDVNHQTIAPHTKGWTSASRCVLHGGAPLKPPSKVRHIGFTVILNLILWLLTVELACLM